MEDGFVGEAPVGRRLDPDAVLPRRKLFKAVLFGAGFGKDGELHRLRFRGDRRIGGRAGKTLTLMEG